MITNNVICGDITEARDQQNLYSVKSFILKFLVAFKLEIAEKSISVSKKEVVNRK